MLMLCSTYLAGIFFAITATSPVNTPAANTIVIEVEGSSPATGGDVSAEYADLSTYGDPNSPVCNAKVGRPGGVYTCPGINFTPSATEQCKWWAPPQAGRTTCISFQKELGLPLSRPQSIGPDPGGYCILFQEPDCKAGAKAFILINGQAYT
jgi:hypothetical protein